MAKENTTVQTAATVTVPEQITIGEQTFTVKETPELEAFVRSVMQSAAQVEKNKLYNTIKGLQDEVRSSQEEINRLRNSNIAQPVHTPLPDKSAYLGTTNGKTQYQTAETEKIKAEARAQNQQSGNLTKEDVADMINNAFRDGVPGLFKQYMEPVVQRLEKAEQEKINEYRSNRLKELGDTVIPEMVMGRTKEEIEASILAAQQIRSRYKTTEKTVPQTTPPGQQITFPPVETPVKQVNPLDNPPRMTTPQEQPKENIRGMSDKEFAEKRENILANLKGEVSAYPQISNEHK